MVVMDAGGPTTDITIQLISSAFQSVSPSAAGDILFRVYNDGGAPTTLSGFGGLSTGYTFFDAGCFPLTTLPPGQVCDVTARFATNLFGPATTSFQVLAGGVLVTSPSAAVERYALLRPEVQGAQSIGVINFDGGEETVSGGSRTIRVGPRTRLRAGDRPGCTFAPEPKIELIDGGPNVFGVAFDGGCQWSRWCELDFPRPAELTLRGGTSVTFVYCTDGVAFVSRDSIAGTAVAATADAVCQGEAADAGLGQPQTFIAVVSFDGGVPSGRLPPTSYWLRPDGVPVARNRAELFAASMRAPIGLRADGTAVPLTSVWTGWQVDGGGSSCWNGTAPTAGTMGQAKAVGVESVEWTSLDCTTSAPVYCAQGGMTAALPTTVGVPDAGRLAFLGPIFSPGTNGYANAVSGCTTAGSGLRPGATFRPMLFMDGGVRFAPGGAWYRPDGVVVFDGRAFLDGGVPLMKLPVHQQNATLFYPESTTWLGSALADCAGWSSMIGPVGGFDTARGYEGSLNLASLSCISSARLLCLQE